jgi:spoIIIJ-associated protein
VTADEGDEGTLESLVGSDGATLDALQDLTRLAVLSATGQRSRVILDIAGHRSRRGERLAALVDGIIENVRETGEAQHLDPMTAYERKQVHDLVAAAGLVSDSEGEGNRRHVVVHPGA